MTEEAAGRVVSQASGYMGVWILVGAALVLWMQAGFAVREIGLLRAKNAGNVVMRKLMEFSLGIVIFTVFGAGFAFGEDCFGIIGDATAKLFQQYENFDYIDFVANLVFCSMAASIASGAMAERAKFSTNCIYTIIITALIYPIVTHWLRGGGWLFEMGIHDFSGGATVHLVGGLCGMLGAALLGPRDGRFIRNIDGNVREIRDIPGHNMPLVALGIFVLWTGWYGFNGVFVRSVEEMGGVFLTTTIAPACAFLACAFITWGKYGKPDVSLCMNSVIAGLVAISPGCDVVDSLGALFIGATAGVLMVGGAYCMENKLHIDDPVGAMAIHFINGAWGMIAVGLYATNTAPGYARGYGDGVNFGSNPIAAQGLFYGGGYRQLSLQILGTAVVSAFVAITMMLVLFGIRRIIGLRTTKEIESEGFDLAVHEMNFAYEDLLPIDRANVREKRKAEEPCLQLEGNETLAEILENSLSFKLLKREGVAADKKVSKVTVVCRRMQLDMLKSAYDEIGITGMTVTQVLGCGKQKGVSDYCRGVPVDFALLPKVKVEVVVSYLSVWRVVEAAEKALHTGHVGDGKIFVYDVSDVVRIRTGERGLKALDGK